MAWGEQPGLVERWKSTKDFLRQTRKRWKLGTSYDAWVGAQMREAPRIIGLVERQLRKHMLQIPSQEPSSRWNALAVDSSMIACPRTRENQRVMGDVGKPDGIPQMSLTAILHLGTNLPWDFRMGPGIDSERGHLIDMLDDLEAKSLFVADAGFIGYELCCKLVARGIHFLLRVGGNIQLLKDLECEIDVVGDFVYLWPLKQQAANQPPLKLRLIVIQDDGKLPVYLITSVLDPQALTDDEAGEIYRQRWGIELFFRHLKQTFGRRKLRSASAANAQVELQWSLVGLWSMALYAQVELHQSGIAPTRLSVAKALRAFRRMLRDYLHPIDRRCSLAALLRQALRDEYQRKNKSSRNYPRKKQADPPAGPPEIKRATAAQIRHARELEFAA